MKRRLAAYVLVVLVASACGSKGGPRDAVVIRTAEAVVREQAPILAESCVGDPEVTFTRTEIARPGRYSTQGRYWAHTVRAQGQLICREPGRATRYELNSTVNVRLAQDASGQWRDRGSSLVGGGDATAGAAGAGDAPAAGGGAAPPPSASAAGITVTANAAEAFPLMRSALQLLMTSEEFYFVDRGRTYTAELDSLKAVGLHVEDGLRISIREAGPTGWSAEVTHVALDAARKCALFYGDVAPLPPATTAGKVACTGE